MRQPSLTPALAFALTIVGCTTKSTPKPESMSNANEPPTSSTADQDATILRPRWTADETWRVNYRIRTPNPAGYANPPPRFETRTWHCAVKAGPDDTIDIVGREPDSRTPDVYDQSFASTGKPLGQDVTTPLISLHFSDLISLDLPWPAFPLQPGQEISARVPDGYIVQTVARLEDGALEATIHRQNDEQTERIAVQRWEPDRPWWSAMTVRSRSVWEGELYEEVELVAETIFSDNSGE